jgi:hypothetical protein
VYKAGIEDVPKVARPALPHQKGKLAKASFVHQDVEAQDSGILEEANPEAPGVSLYVVHGRRRGGELDQDDGNNVLGAFRIGEAMEMMSLFLATLQ